MNGTLLPCRDPSFEPVLLFATRYRQIGTQFIAQGFAPSAVPYLKTFSMLMTPSRSFAPRPKDIAKAITVKLVDSF
jgi:hypothetical protein